MRSSDNVLVARVAGVGACLAAAAALSTATRLSLPVMPLCLVVGIVFGALGARTMLAQGAEIAAGNGLRLGVALLGLQSMSLNGTLVGNTFLLAACVIVTALASGWAGAKLLRLPTATGFVAGAAVGVCGVTAAVAIAGVVGERERAKVPLGAIVLWVSLLSSAAMIMWPALAGFSGMSDLEAGVAVGGSVHDVAQATAAGYSISAEAGATAAIAKMARVALLTPLLLLTMASVRSGRFDLASIPWYLPLFVVLTVLTNLGWTPDALREAGAVLSRLLLAAGLFAIGVRTRWGDLAGVGWRMPVLLTVQSALVIGVAYLIAVWLF